MQVTVQRLRYDDFKRSELDLYSKWLWSEQKQAGPAFARQWREVPGQELELCRIAGQDTANLLLSRRWPGQPELLDLLILGPAENDLPEELARHYFRRDEDLCYVQFLCQAERQATPYRHGFLQRFHLGPPFYAWVRLDAFDLALVSDDTGSRLAQSEFLRDGQAAAPELTTFLRYLGALDAEGCYQADFPPERLDDLAAHYSAAAKDLFAQAKGELAAYWSGELTTFTTPLALPADGSFSAACWAALQDIPYGAVESYEAVAARALGERAGEARRYARACGVAMSKNPLVLFLPCHRVVGSKGELTGFGGGVDLKAELLNFELLHYKES